MHCTSCGKQLPTGASACPSCGTPVAYPGASPAFQDAPTQADAQPSYDFGPFQENVSRPRPPDPFGQPQPSMPPPWQAPQAPQPPAQQAYYATSPTPTPTPTPPPMQSMPPVQPGQPLPTGRRGLSRGMTALLVVLALLVMFSGFGLIYYSVIYHPAQLHAEATATVQVVDTQQARTTATANAQATGTAIAIANATATANAQATAQAVATATALANIYTQATGGTPAINDSLSFANNWAAETGVNGGGCNFSAGAYHITEPTKGFFLFCPASGSNFSNCAFQVRIDMIAGDFAGIGIRANESAGSAYYFTIYSDGSYDFSVWKNRNGDDSRSLQTGNSSGIKVGHNQINTVTLIARNHTFYLYVNKQYVATVQDSTLGAGEIGLFGGDQTHPADVAFSNAKVWRL